MAGCHWPRGHLSYTVSHVAHPIPSYVQLGSHISVGLNFWRSWQRLTGILPMVHYAPACVHSSANSIQRSPVVHVFLSSHHQTAFGAHGINGFLICKCSASWLVKKPERKTGSTDAANTRRHTFGLLAQGHFFFRCKDTPYDHPPAKALCLD